MREKRVPFSLFLDIKYVLFLIQERKLKEEGGRREIKKRKRNIFLYMRIFSTTTEHSNGNSLFEGSRG